MTEDYPIFYNGTDSPWNEAYCLFPDGFTPKVILDIGAYDGTFAARCKSLWPDCKIFSLEPDIQNVTDYKVKTNHHPDCNIINGYFGYYDKGYFNILDVSRSDCAISWFPIGRESYKITKELKRYTLLDLFQLVNDEIDVIKINCCGAEFDLLKNSQDLLLLQQVSYICGVTWGGVIRNPALEAKARSEGLSEYTFTNLLQSHIKSTHDVISYKKDWRGCFWANKKLYTSTKNPNEEYKDSGDHNPFGRMEMGLE